MNYDPEDLRRMEHDLKAVSVAYEEVLNRNPDLAEDLRQLRIKTRERYESVSEHRNQT